MKAKGTKKKKANNFEGVSSRIGIGIWRDFDDDDDGARDRVRRVSRQLLSQGIYNIEVFLCLSLVCDVAADCDDDDVHPFFLVESLTKTRVLLFSSVKKHVSTPTFMPGDVTVCREYQHEACCTLDTVRKCVVLFFKRPKKADREIARDCLDKVKMLPFANRQISNLSGGQQQRVFLARALAQESDVYFMDEPFAGVDAATESAIITLLHELREKGKTLLVVHHDLPTARNYFDQLLLLNMRVVAYGNTEDVFTYDLLQKTYGGRLTILSEVADAIRQREN